MAATQVRRDGSIRGTAGGGKRWGWGTAGPMSPHHQPMPLIFPGDAYGADVVNDLERRERLASNLV